MMLPYGRVEGKQGPRLARALFQIVLPIMFDHSDTART